MRFCVVGLAHPKEGHFKWSALIVHRIPTCVVGQSGKSFEDLSGLGGREMWLLV